MENIFQLYILVIILSVMPGLSPEALDVSPSGSFIVTNVFVHIFKCIDPNCLNNRLDI
jgi:hypothetical protein